MNQPEAKDKIVSLLEEIVERAHFINQNHPQKDLSLDIDAVMDDLRSLYRQFTLLKKENSGANQFHAPEESFVSSKDIEREEKEPETKTEEPRKHLPFVYDESTTDQAPTEEEKQTPPEPRPEPENFTRETPPQKEDHPAPASEVEQKAPTVPSDEKTEEKDEIKEEKEEKKENKTPTQADTKGEGMESKHEDHHEPEDTPGQEQFPSQPPKPEKTQASAPGNGSKAIIDLFSDSPSNAIGDQYRKDDNSLHQRISGQKEDKSIGTRMQQKGISSLKDAIGVNDKFLFINELFNGNIQAYNEAISKLNNSDSLNEAFDYLNELNREFAWDAKRSEQTIEKLAAFVQRRYAGN